MVEIKVDFVKGDIIVSHAFLQKASVVGTPEHQKFMKYRKEFADFTLKVRKPKCHANRYYGLTYTYMEDYIMTHERAEDVMKVLNEYWELHTKAACHSKAFRYPVIKRWFLNHYPEVVTYGTEDQSQCEIKALPKAAS